jgi:hypothetical protein
MATHYVVAIVVALICGFFFYKVTNDIPGFQNRLGLFLFILSLFGFSTLSSIGIFGNERMLFMRERANGYYAPVTYFLSKVGRAGGEGAYRRFSLTSFPCVSSLPSSSGRSSMVSLG